MAEMPTVTLRIKTDRDWIRLVQMTYALKHLYEIAEEEPFGSLSQVLREMVDEHFAFVKESE